MVSSLLANPKVQSNPAYLAEATLINQTANTLVEEYTSVQAQNSSSSTDNPSQSGQITSPTLEGATPSSSYFQSSGSGWGASPRPTIVCNIAGQCFEGNVLIGLSDGKLE